MKEITNYIQSLDVTDKTIKSYKKNLKVFNEYLIKNGYMTINENVIIGYKKHLLNSNLANNTVQAYLTTLKSYLKWYSRTFNEYDYSTVIKGIKVSREHKKDCLSTNQARELLSSIDRNSNTGKRDYALILLMLTGALRTIEITNIDRNDIRFKGDNIILEVLGKGRTEKDNYIKLSNETYIAINEYLEDRNDRDMVLFKAVSNRSNGRMTSESISRIVKQRLRDIGINNPRITAHSLRHTSITLSLIGGASIQEAMLHARHSNINTTMIYNHSLDKAKNVCSSNVERLLF